MGCLLNYNIDQKTQMTFSHSDVSILLIVLLQQLCMWCWLACHMNLIVCPLRSTIAAPRASLDREFVYSTTRAL